MSPQSPSKADQLAKLEAAVAKFIEEKSDPLANHPLTPYREPIKKLRTSGASFSDIVEVLKAADVVATQSQVSYFIKLMKTKKPAKKAPKAGS